MELILICYENLVLGTVARGWGALFATFLCLYIYRLCSEGIHSFIPRDKIVSDLCYSFSRYGLRFPMFTL